MPQEHIENEKLKTLKSTVSEAISAFSFYYYRYWTLWFAWTRQRDSIWWVSPCWLYYRL